MSSSRDQENIPLIWWHHTPQSHLLTFDLTSQQYHYNWNKYYLKVWRNNLLYSGSPYWQYIFCAFQQIFCILEGEYFLCVNLRVNICLASKFMFYCWHWHIICSRHYSWCPIFVPRSWVTTNAHWDSLNQFLVKTSSIHTSLD